MNHEINPCWEALDLLRTLTQQRRNHQREIDRIDARLVDVEERVRRVFEANGYPARVAIANDIFECRRSGSGQAIITFVPEEEVVRVHDLKAPAPDTVEVEEEDEVEVTDF